ncbi:MAG: tRNA (adenosine(37)-N6)-threonylcarbamoyltransferase complex ATPase subunit type 1 TsaE, partial [Chloroflexota bacterium]
MKNVNITLKLTSDEVETTELVGEMLGKQLQTADVICLIGELGAGKTALTRGIGRGWGTTQRVTSPTFTLINEYARPTDQSILYHLDCYRLVSEDDVETIGLEDILAADGAVIIEW